MKLSVLVTLSLVSLGSLLAGDLQQLADNLQVKAPTADDKKLTMPRVKEATIRLQGADYEQIIDKKGKIRFPMSDTEVRLSFKLSRDGKKAISRDYQITVPGLSKNKAGSNPKPQVIPELLSRSGGQGTYTLPKEITVCGGGMHPCGMMKLTDCIKATAPWIYGSVCRIHQEINTIKSCCPLLH